MEQFTPRQVVRKSSTFPQVAQSKAPTIQPDSRDIPKNFSLVLNTDDEFSLQPFSPNAYSRNQQKIQRLLSLSKDPELDLDRIHLSNYLANRTTYSPEYIFSNPQKVLNEVMGYDMDLDTKKGVDYFFSTIKYQVQQNRANLDFERRGDRIKDSGLDSLQKEEAYAALRSDIQKFQNSLPAFDKVKGWVPKSLLDGIASTIPYMGRALAGNLIGGAAGAGLAVLIGGLTLPAFLTAAALSTAGAKVGGMIGTKPLLNASGYTDRLMMQDKNGEYMDPVMINWGSELSSWVEAAVESLAFSVFAPWAGKLFAGGASQLLVNKSIGSMVKTGLFTYGKGIVAESAEEGLQRIVRDVTDNILKTMDANDGGRDWERLKASQILDNASQEFLQSIPTMAVLGVFSGAVGAGINVVKNKAALKYDANTYFDGEGNEVSLNDIIFDKTKYGEETQSAVDNAKKGKQKLKPVKVVFVGTINGRKIYRAVEGQESLSAIEESGGKVARVEVVSREGQFDQLGEENFNKLSEIVNNIGLNTDSYVRVVDGKATVITRDNESLRKFARGASELLGIATGIVDQTLNTNEFGVPVLTLNVLINGQEAEIQVMTEAVDSVRNAMYGKSVERFIKDVEAKLGVDAVRVLKDLLSSVYKRSDAAQDVYKANTIAHGEKQSILEELTRLNEQIDGGSDLYTEAAKLLSQKKKPNVKQSRKVQTPQRAQEPAAEKELHEQTIDEAIEGAQQEQQTEGKKKGTAEKAKSQQAAEEWKKPVENKKVDEKFEKHVAELVARVNELDSKAGTKTVILSDPRDFPESVRKKAERGGLNPDKINGVYANGRVYINARNVSLAEVDRTWAHEWIAHKGLSALLGSDYRAELEKLFDSIGEKTIKDTIHPFYHSLSKAEMADEYMAVVAERFQKDGTIPVSFLEKLQAVIRSAVRKLGINITYNNADLKALLNNAYRAINKDTITTTDGEMLQVDAWHGSPYQFNKFSLNRIGTGEGAQAFGWGMYFSELKDVAKYYAANLGGGNSVIINGNRYSGSMLLVLEQKLIDTFPEQPGVGLVDTLVTLHINDWDFKKVKEIISADSIPAAIKNSAISWVELLEKEVVVEKAGGRNLYKTTLYKGKDPSKYTFMDWNKQLSPEVYSKIEAQLVKEYDQATADDYLTMPSDRSRVAYGARVYERMSYELFGIPMKLNATESARETSLFLLRAGIDGNRYPAQSMGQGDGSKGYNYVVFDENAITIEEQIRFQMLPEKGFYEYQDQNMEKTHKQLFYMQGQNAEYAERIENAGDIGRELSKSESGYVDNNYIFEKLNKLRTIIEGVEGSAPWRQKDFMKLPVGETADMAEFRVRKKYKEQYNAYRGRLGTLGEASKKLSFAVLDRDLEEMRKAFVEFYVEYDKFKKLDGEEVVISPKMSKSLAEEIKTAIANNDAGVRYQTAPEGKMYLYRGLETEFDSNYDLSSTDAPNGYSTWTDNPELARQYAGENGRVYRIELPIELEGSELIDIDGERALFVDNQKPAGLNGVSGNEYLVYNYHDEYSPELITEMPEGHIRFQIAPPDYQPKNTGIGYKVFMEKDGKLYPPMVANPEGKDTPVGKWLFADSPQIAGYSKTGRPQVKAGGKGTNASGGLLAYRPGWHLGEIPYAKQFDRKNPETGVKELFPANFVWAEVEYPRDYDYNEEALNNGITENGKYRHAYASLDRMPENGFYNYRTNPDPTTDPWIITGAMKVNKILSRSEVNNLVMAAGREPQKVFGDILFQIAPPTDSEAFKKWFGNSKVVDENGKPLVVYNGTHTSLFSAYNTPAYFAESPVEAAAYSQYSNIRHRDFLYNKYVPLSGAEYAGQIVESYPIMSDIPESLIGEVVATDNGVVRKLKGGRYEIFTDIDLDYNEWMDSGHARVKKADAQRWYDEAAQEAREYADTYFGEGDTARIYPVYLSIQNPAYLSPLEGNRFSERISTREEIDELTKKYRDQGYDGVITDSDQAMFPGFSEDVDGKIRNYVAFSPTQIKSVYNQGTWDSENADIRFQLSASHIAYAEGNGYIDSESSQMLDALLEITDIDKELNRVILSKTSSVGMKVKNYAEINTVLDNRPDLVDAIRSYETIFEASVLDENNHLISSPIEQRTSIKKSSGKEYLTFHNFLRSIGQTYIDSMPYEKFEKLRAGFVQSIEQAYSNKKTLPKGVLKDLFGKKAGNLDSLFSTQAPLRDAHKTEAALNLNSQCPMYNIGARGCYLDGCYVTSMGAGGSAVNYYARAMYTGEILQLSDEVVKSLNKIGGLRLNGAGDIDASQAGQLRDILRHAAMRGLKLKVITKQEATIEIINSLAKDSGDSMAMWGAMNNIIVQTTVDPFWVDAYSDNYPNSGAEPFIKSLIKLEELGDRVDVEIMQDELIAWYESMGFDARIINGKVFRKYGFSSSQIKEIAKKYPDVKILIRSVVSTPKEIAEYALHAPEVLQTWMHAAIHGEVYSDTEGRLLTEGEMGNYTVRIGVVQITPSVREKMLSDLNAHYEERIQKAKAYKPAKKVLDAMSETELQELRDSKVANVIKDRASDKSFDMIKNTSDGEWKVMAAAGANTPALQYVKAYDAVEKYIKNNYTPAEQERIFGTLSGQLKDNPSALCCSSGADTNACNDCASACQSGSYFTGESLERLAETAGEKMLFQISEKEIRSRHRQAVKRAVERGLPVPTANLELYRDDPWAKKELDRRELFDMFPWILELAKEADSAQDLMEMVSSRLEHDGENREVGMEFVEEAFTFGNMEGNEQQFINEFTDLIGTNTGIVNMLKDINKNREKFYGLGMPRSVFQAADKADSLTPAEMDDLRASIYRNLRRSTRAYYQGTNNFEAIQSFKAGDVQGADVDIDTLSVEDRVKLASLIEDQQLKNTILRGDFTYGTFSELLRGKDAELAKQIKAVEDVDRKIDKLEQKLRDTRREFQEQKSGIRADRDTKLKQQMEKYQTTIQALREHRDTKLKQQREQIRAKQEELKNAKKVRRQMRAWFTRIQRRVPPGSVDYEYGKKLDILTSLFSQKVRNDAGHEGRVQKLINLIADFDKMSISELTQESKGLEGLVLDEFLYEQLEYLFDRMEKLRAAGRKLKGEKDFIRKEQRLEIIRLVRGELLRGDAEEVFKAFGSKETDKAMKSGSAFHVWAATLRPPRMIRKLGGEVMYDWYVDKVNAQTDAELREWYRRHEAGVKKMKELGITAKELARSVSADGKTFSADQVIHLYLAMMNDKSKAAVIFGNKISEDLAGTLVSQLTQKEKDWGLFMLQDFEDNYDRLNEAFIQDKNIDMGKEKNYFPMMRKDFENQALGAGELMGEQWSIRNAWKKGYAPKKFTIARTEIADEHQVPIQLGATSIWLSQIEAQEHYINAQELIKDLQYIQNDQSIKDALKQKYGVKASKWLQKYVNDYALPSSYKSSGTNGFEKVSRMLRSNMAIAYLSFNALTVLKQAPSLGFYLRAAGPQHLLSSAMKMITNPRGMMRDVELKDPQVLVRSYNRITEELYRMSEDSAVSRLKKRVGTMGMKPIMWMDKAIITMGWDAVYNRSIAKGMTEAEAAKEAQRVTLDTQPAGRAKDLAELYRSNEAANWLLMFSNQLNQIWNMYSFDLPQAIKEHEFRKAAGIVAGLMVSGLSIALLSGWRPPEDEKEIPASLARELFANYLSSMSIIGGDIKSGFAGEYFASGMQIVPAAKSIGTFIGDVADGDIENMGKDFVRLLKDAGVTLGVPTTAIDRTYKTIANRDLLELLGYGFTKNRR